MLKYPSVPTADDRTMYQLELLPNANRFTENDKRNAEKEQMRSHLNCIISVNQTRQKKKWTPLIPFTEKEKEWYDAILVIDTMQSVPRGGFTKKRRNSRYSRKEKRR